MVYETLDSAIARAVADQPALMAARAAWDREAGVVHHDDPLFEERAAAFLEWFLIDWRPSGGAPIEALLAGAAGERAVLLALAGSHRSLFRVRELFPDGVLLDDLWGGGVFRVRERRRLAGLDPGEIFDGRLVADPVSPPDLHFARTFCFHPRAAEGAMLALIDRARASGESRDALLFRLLRLRVKCERYKHVSPARVYAE